ncbi:MAG: hypothetical protein LBE59_04760 [Nevskiaceae bacterium]|jgi:hypothetical protein|nr:hypothetical protein [Nevskiaceae bacterium]
MKFNKALAAGALGLLASAFSGVTMAGQAAAPVAVVPPPRAFATAQEHFEYLKREAKGGTRHTYDSIPKWEGLWSASYNSVARGDASPFFEGANGGQGAGGVVKEGVLTPAYEAAFKQRRENMHRFNGQPFDRLTFCEAAGPVRWLLEPYVREFVNTPTQSWWMNDLANETIRVYIDQEHKNVEGSHTADGDAIGFWAGNKLVVWVNAMWPAEFFRSYPPYSNEMEIVEVYEMTTDAEGKPSLVAQVTFYDPVALAKPLNGVYVWRPAEAQQKAGYRIRHWDCSTGAQIPGEGDTTSIRLPGESGKTWHQMRNPDLPADLPGQTQSPNQLDFDSVFDEPAKQ